MKKGGVSPPPPAPASSTHISVDHDAVSHMSVDRGSDDAAADDIERSVERPSVVAASIVIAALILVPLSVILIITLCARLHRQGAAAELLCQRFSCNSHTHTHTHPFDGPFYNTRKVKPIWILLKQATVSGSGISWAICKSASRSRQITMPVPHHSFFTGRMPFLPPNQQLQSTEGSKSVAEID